MSGELKDYIDSHRDDFDDATPDARLWQQIEQRIAIKPNSPVVSMRTFRWSLGIAVTLLVAVSTALFYHRPGDVVSGAVAPPTTDTLYTQELYHFTQIIRLKFREIDAIKATHPELYQRFSADIWQLDSSYQQLQQQLPNGPDQEMVLQAMLQNLTLQIDLINRQLGIIQELKNESHAKPRTRI
jgi:hypothetical protein